MSQKEPFSTYNINGAFAFVCLKSQMSCNSARGCKNLKLVLYDRVSDECFIHVTSSRGVYKQKSAAENAAFYRQTSGEI